MPSNKQNQILSEISDLKLKNILHQLQVFLLIFPSQFVGHYILYTYLSHAHI